MKTEPRSMEWMQKAILMRKFGYVPDDLEERYFLLGWAEVDD